MPKLIAMAIALLLAGTAATTAQAKRNSSYRMTVLRTAYCLRGTMADGHYVHWGAVATDRRVIPQGARMYIPGYGWGRAEDTGSAVVGRHIDVWVPNCNVALHMTKYVTITIYR